ERETTLPPCALRADADRVEHPAKRFVADDQIDGPGVESNATGARQQTLTAVARDGEASVARGVGDHGEIDHERDVVVAGRIVHAAIGARRTGEDPLLLRGALVEATVLAIVDPPRLRRFVETPDVAHERNDGRTGKVRRPSRAGSQDAGMMAREERLE